MTIVLQTERLILKVPDQSHFDDLLALCTDAEVMRYIGDGRIRTKEQVSELLALSVAYFQKHGTTFFSVFEKQSNHFVGMAGLLHLCFDENQPDIEVGYRLHKQYWRQGYATELTRALIEWGFSVLKLQRIIAITHPDNAASRRVMEKSGMSYHAMIQYKGMTIPCYEILNNKITLTDITLHAASLQDYPAIQNMGRFYVYDMTEYMGKEAGWEMPEDGLYECIDFKKYWEVEGAFQFLIRYQRELAGFVIVDKKGSEPDVDFNMAQFYILRKFKGKGVGRYVAEQCFENFRGKWEVMVMPGNEGAYRFWRACIKHYTGGNFAEYTREIAHFNNSRKNIFTFDSGDTP